MSHQAPRDPPSSPLHQLAVLFVDYLVSTGVLKDAEALRAEGARRERQRAQQAAKKKSRSKSKKKSPVKAKKK